MPAMHEGIEVVIAQRNEYNWNAISNREFEATKVEGQTQSFHACEERGRHEYLFLQTGSKFTKQNFSTALTVFYFKTHLFW